MENNQGAEKDPKNVLYENVLLAIPTFGKVSINFMVSQTMMSVPIFTSMAYMYIQGKPVDVARNEIAWYALNNLKAGYVFFRDDDVLVPRDALIKLFKRLTPKQRHLPHNLGDAIVGGVVYSKTQPPVPMIYKKGVTAGFEDWNNMDVVECDAIGMGCTLIPIGVFEKMLPVINHYRCVNAQCPVNWEVEYKEGGQCPHCKADLIPGWFKTVRDYDDSGNPAYLTEDAYFCLKAAEAGIKTYADCGVHCWHEDFENKIQYGYHPNIGPCWKQNDTIFYWPDLEDPIHKKKPKPKAKRKGKKVKFNLGCCGEKKSGYVNIDLYTPADVRCDIKDITPVVKEYGFADEILAKQVLEHIDRDYVLGTVRNWLKALKSGGVLKIEVPDFWWIVKQIKELEEKGNKQAYYFPEATIFGLQSREGEYHKTMFTAKKVEHLIKACKNLVKSYEIVCEKPRDYNQGVIKITIVRK
jgi:predicted SAM-dependent methyltransferase